jgi:alanine dehydrogenase
MSRIAGRMAVQAGAYFLEAAHGGKGILLGGIPGVSMATVVVLGAGTSGWHAIDVAVGLGARVIVLDISLPKLASVESFWGGRVETLFSTRHAVQHAVADADLVIGAVLVAGRRAPVVVDAAAVRSMAPGSVLVDISIDQGGCFETSRETTHSDPVYSVDGVIHYAVGNIPGAVPRTSTFALTNATLRYTVDLAGGLAHAAARHPELVAGINVAAGEVTNPVVADTLGMAYTPADQIVR